MEKIYFIEYKNIFGEYMQLYCTIQEEVNEEGKKERFFVDIENGYKIPFSKQLIKEADFLSA